MYDIHRLLAEQYARERKKLGDSFLAALYNLQLPDEDLSQEEKKRLSYVVWLFFRFPSNNLSEPQFDDYDRAPGYGFDDGFFIRADMMDYQQTETDWWTSKDFKAYQRNFQHLRGLIESCIEGESYGSFQRVDLKWLDEKIRHLLHFSIQLQFKSPVFLVAGKDGTVEPAEIPPDVTPPLLPIGSAAESSPPPDGCVHAYLDLPRTGGAWLFRQSEDGNIPFDQFNPVIVHSIERDMPPSDRILCQAYLEILGAISRQLKFRRCQAGPTTKYPACQNIFLIKKQRGPQKRWCSNSCKRRVYEHKKKVRNRTKNMPNYG